MHIVQCSMCVCVCVCVYVYVSSFVCLRACVKDSGGEKVWDRGGKKNVEWKKDKNNPL